MALDMKPEFRDCYKHAVNYYDYIDPLLDRIANPTAKKGLELFCRNPHTLQTSEHRFNYNQISELEAFGALESGLSHSFKAANATSCDYNVKMRADEFVQKVINLRQSGSISEDASKNMLEQCVNLLINTNPGAAYIFYLDAIENYPKILPELEDTLLRRSHSSAQAHQINYRYEYAKSRLEAAKSHPSIFNIAAREDAHRARKENLSYEAVGKTLEKNPYYWETWVDKLCHRISLIIGPA